MMRALVVALVLAPLAARAEPVTLVGGGGSTLSAVVLVGSHGERFTRDAQGVWRQAAGGGVATDLMSARGQGTIIWGVGMRTPPFAHDGKSWNAVPTPTKGALILGEGPALTIAVGKRIYLREGREWKALGAVAKNPARLWAASIKNAKLFDRDGGLSVWNGSAWKPVRLERQKQSALALFGDGKGEGAPLEPGDAPVAVLKLDGARMLVATRRGAVHVRDGAWRLETLDAAPAVAPAHPQNPPAPSP